MTEDKNRLAAPVYDKISSEYSEKFHETSDFIDNFISFLQPGAKVLDVGCGPGIDSRYLKEKGFDAEGIDLSARMLRIARTNAPDVRFRRMDMLSLKYPSDKFDGLFVSYSLIHVPKSQTARAIKELKRVLKKNGIIYLGLQGGTGERFVQEPLNPKYRMFLHFFGMKEITGLLRKNGFAILFKAIGKPKCKEEFQCKKLYVIARKMKQIQQQNEKQFYIARK